ncbi:CFI-box-CTERM domain-containing protein [Cysteiniphilum marinum]|uniref:CFI-box-CTERM domain-containing protein n=1 Tax=Cysteiniphilum marinum TaxID=2774191 RepID=UPI001F253797|nr:CFI-box-CTERM domain-containing protein [Cysteiniphilum marinum]
MNCKKCNGVLKERKSRKGEFFLGCSNFPKCRYTESIASSKDVWVTASEIGEVTFCPMSFYLKKQGVKRSQEANDRLAKGTQMHKLAASDNVRYSGQRNNNCYIATYLYGTDHEITNLLRDYRDNKLLKTSIGSAIVNLYYKTSPLLIKYFGRSKVFRIVSKHLVDWFVKHIVKRGI